MKKSIILFACMLTSSAAFAQDAPAAEEATSKFAAAVDVVYPYMWRGPQLTGNSLSIQPYISYAFSDKLSAGLWASAEVSGSDDAYNEVDWYLSYQASPLLNITLSDYYYFSPASMTNYFDFGATGAQAIDLSFLFDFSEKGVPMDFQWNTLVAGNDFNGEGKRAYCSYAEAGYSHSLEDAGIDLRAFVGVVMSDSSAYYGMEGFVFNNIGLRMDKTFSITENFELPLFIRYSHGDGHYVSGGFTLNIK